MEKPKPRCCNCIFRSDYFRISKGGMNHCHCFHPKLDEGMIDGTLSAWDSLMEFWETCSDHKHKPTKTILT